MVMDPSLKLKLEVHSGFKHGGMGGFVKMAIFPGKKRKFDMECIIYWNFVYFRPILVIFEPILGQKHFFNKWYLSYVWLG